MQGVSDGDLLISGLQHFSFCRRQWALAYIEMQWDDNYLTVDGSLRHDRADDPEFTEKRGGLIVSRAIPVRSERYGIVGKCDVVEFRADPGGVPLAGRDGLWLPTPVEYKRGRPKEIDADRLQLCAEAICLEEMLCCPPIPTAYLYYMETKRRESVALSPELRNEVERMLTEMRALYEEMAALQTQEAKIYKALDKMEAVVSHNESDIATWEPQEYSLNLTYGVPQTRFAPYMQKLRETLKQETLHKMAENGKEMP